MFRIVILLLIIVPALEIALLMLSGNYVGAWPTIGLIITTGLVGAWLAKKQGMYALKDAQLQLSKGRIPGDVVLDGICILVGGTLLLTPGFITDTIGFFLLIPTTRLIAKRWLRKLFKKMVNNGQFFIIRK